MVELSGFGLLPSVRSNPPRVWPRSVRLFCIVIASKRARETVIVIIVFGLILLVSCSGVVIGCRRRYLNKHAESVKPTDAPAFDFDDVNNLSALTAPPRNIALPTT